jgi:hypothetical protein
MPLYTTTYEVITRHIHEVEADNEYEATLKFGWNESVCVDTTEEVIATAIQQIERSQK